MPESWICADYVSCQEVADFCDVVRDGTRNCFENESLCLQNETCMVCGVEPEKSGSDDDEFGQGKSARQVTHQ